jgi:uncharacterized protein
MSIPNEHDKILLTGLVGSKGYGTATELSDTDLMSVVIPSCHLYLSGKQWGNSGTMEDEYDDPEKGFVEHKYFELRKFIGLNVGFNPNTIPLLWLQPEHYEVITPEGALLLKNRTLFNSKKAYHTFSGFAHSQLARMGGVFNTNEEPNKLLKKGHERFQEWTDKEIQYMRNVRDVREIELRVGTLIPDLTPYDEGYLNALIALRTHSKEECKRIKDGPITGRMGAARKELRDKFSYDVKFAYHTIRLMTMCVEFLKHPEEGLKVYRKGIDSHFLFSIREGKFTQEEVKKMADELFAEAKEALTTSPLPDEPDHKAIEELMMELIWMSFRPAKGKV